MWTLQEEFSRVEIGRSTQFRNLTLFPLVRRNVTPADLDYLLLEDGIAHKKVRVTEVNGGGAVSELHLENTAELPILVVRQNFVRPESGSRNNVTGFCISC